MVQQQQTGRVAQMIRFTQSYPKNEAVAKITIKLPDQHFRALQNLADQYEISLQATEQVQKTISRY